MRARLVVFPIKGRNWCFSRSIDPLTEGAASSQTPSSLQELWRKISSSHSSSPHRNAELLIDFFSNKMNKAWTGLEKAPQGTFKNKLHGLGLKLLAGVKPSEIFLKSISNEVTRVEIMFPSSLNARLVRRRLRHMAVRGAAVHKNYLYGSAALLPLTSVFMVLPLPNVPFFWVLFRTYSHWRALQGSEKLLRLVSDGSCNENSDVEENKTQEDDSRNEFKSSQPDSLWELQPSKELEELTQIEDEEGVRECAILKISNTFQLNANDVLKFRHKL